MVLAMGKGTGLIFGTIAGAGIYLFYSDPIFAVASGICIAALLAGLMEATPIATPRRSRRNRG